MAGVAIIISSIDRAASPAGQYHVEGLAIADNGVEFVPWDVSINFTDGTLAVNTACKDAAVAALQAVGFTIAPSDQKTLFASAVIA